ncbi:hypothetical protein E1298_38750 [Actinomadura rubrisoli]|uniref:Uncharacterized protein n=1 Tax=Actinomadura rubrisoli TaxID=2530368 RepID=A0A4R5AAJ9_9ACTN|nr:hypothetical protein E1298_38750 [Actinomadura rubrisoli]
MDPRSVARRLRTRPGRSAPAPAGWPRGGEGPAARQPRRGGTGRDPRGPFRNRTGPGNAVFPGPVPFVRSSGRAPGPPGGAFGQPASESSLPTRDTPSTMSSSPSA